MENIQMVDLKGQYDKIKVEVNSAIQSVIDSSAFIKGPALKKFQKELETYMAVKHVIPCANGTDALQLALMGLNLKPGDEIITSPFTFIATIEVIQLLGLKPVLVDIDPDTFNINPENIKKAITSRTKAIMPVHLFGQCANMDKILELAETHNLFVIEDTAQAIGAKYNFNNGRTGKAGTLGHIGTTSFFPSKNLGAFGDGGAIFTNDDELAEKLSIIANHGMKQQYYYEQVGLNSRLDSLQAAILSVKLKYLDAYNKARQKAAAYYDTAFQENPQISPPFRFKNSEHIFHQYTLKVKNGKRDALKHFLNEKGIPAMIYYPVGLHLQEAYKNLGYVEGDFPITEKICTEVLSLPMHTELDELQLKYITESVNEFFK
ncbi:MAG: DegT/DnrJ/EryC1/StrS family aminotransferase [Bacteroidales bacterium]|nr:DegT/DnrJ/EryC1/StrS family aminotransferase [Bacteroidales bacterium]MCF8389190.1 DegT/DnrJ/EryC1/StrS family aminotransferase [Bacteroidales bacterium]